ncbi:hypothetical protein PFDG_00026 [Plasmodium falciparum Dd2]|uniref:Erythrocyte membrane protein 1, PfEMP1 n=1 Tax=Plasmodium falciparum (isolate Dd2) TaxID=57267 RepID=A0A0L7LVP2_PLAF4|nr:hypothetical protein PFDG_00026 [Plasmodium falciparum Dd2]
MGPKEAAGGDDIEDESAKHMFDRIGKDVYDKVKEEAKERGKGLQGRLSEAKFEKNESDPQTPEDPCDLDHKYHTNVTTNVINPCADRSDVRFSDEYGGQCTHNRIKDSQQGDNKGACAPYRRLHVCDQNLEQIEPIKITNTHNLLVDVCMAAKFEGQSITQDYPKYQATYGDSPSQICTMLARSFADIGDIVRGRDLYLGNPQEIKQRQQLENNLKTIFGKIYEKLNGAEARYGNDPEFFKLREDWWTANRETVWKAITCNAWGNTYFHATCNRGERTKGYCRCNDDQVPTYFDYVPQYLRWFEEWAEDFCRKKNKKIKDVKRNCRGKDKEDKDRYCSRNGYDCEKTKRAIGKLRYGKQCISCLYACNPYVDWINNQKEQFDKQKKKYDEEIKKYENGASGGSRQKRDAGGTTTTNYDGYEKKFYDELNKSEYRTVDKFLEKLSNEEICTKVKDEEGGTIDFKNVNSDSTSGASGTNVESQGTFYRSKYCQPCPYCGVKKVNNGGSSNEWEEKNNGKCKSGKLYEPKPDKEGTTITILKSGKGHDDIEEKLNKFCDEKNGDTINSGGSGTGGSGGGNSGRQELYEEWKCYKGEDVVKVGHDEDDEEDYENVKNAGGLCILKNQKKNKEEGGNTSEKEPDEIQKTFNPFFYYWVAHMLKDSIHWKKKLQRCLQNGNRIKCGNNKCNNDCECFKRWITQKKDEWGKIVQHFKTQNIKGRGGSDNTAELIPFDHDYVLQYNLQEEFLKGDSEDASEEKSENSLDAEEAEELKHLREIIESEDNNQEASVGGGVTEQKNIMDKLLNYEKDEADLCLEIHEDEEEEKEKGDGNECIEEGENFRYNPCSGESGNKRYPVLANKVAYQMHHKAKTQLASRAGRSALRGDISLAQFKNGRNGSTLKGQICKINENYSNDSRGNSGGPCTGKDGDHGGVRMRIGTEWSNIEGKKQTSYKNVFLPPRREHMCTSNLENLDVGSVTKNDKASHSLLGDVQLAAKTDAAEIIKRYKDQNNIQLTDPIQQKDQEAMCRAVRYSFADLGDIIRGRDMWDEDKSSTDMETRLITVFKNIKEKHDGIKDNPKYTGDESKKPAYKKLRADWWEANRHQVWRAMKCATKGIICPGMPVDDYIPQRLRWMTEWAEWYCKAQSQEYDKLKKICADCMSKGDGKCTQGDVDCGKCKAACDKYKEEIEKWNEQWRKISDKYNLLYLQAKTTSTNPGRTVLGDDDPDYQQMVDFLTPIHKASIAARVLVKRAAGSPTEIAAAAPITPYSTAAGYIHQEIGYGGCQEQTQFCEKKHGATSTSTTKENKEYTFKQPPPEYATACDCINRSQTEEPKKKEENVESACKIVEKILEGKNGRTTVGECNPKESYPDWDCKNNIDISHDGACMPPRRQKLCLYYIAHESQTENIKTDDNLKDAFIKTAAAETFLSWQYYKSKNDSEAKILDRGLIPSQFLRSMMYTFGDYRDICLNTDISKKQNDVAKAKDKIGKFFSKDGSKSPSGLSRQEWWKTNGPEIWKGMLCALTKYVTDTDNKRKIKNDYSYDKVNQSQNGNPSLEEFAAKPQFLRWMIEWGEEFCAERQKKENIIKDACNEINSTQQCNDAKHRCNQACRAYQEYVENKKKEFSGQTNNFVLKANVQPQDPEYKGYEYKDGVQPIQGNEYLLQKCDNNKCSCMDGNVLSVSPKEKPFGKYAHKYPEKCDCYQGKHVPSIPPPPPPVQPQPEAPTVTVDVCSIVKTLFKDTNNFSDACGLKYGKTAPSSWKCIPSDTKSGAGATTGKSGSDSGSICIPPRRRRLYVGKLQEWATALPQGEGAASPSHSRADDLRNAFIQSAAIETFFLWDRYKEEKKPQGDGSQQALSQLTSTYSDDEEDPPDKLLQNGKIPPDFLRLMFYTLGDYRDILVRGGSNTNGDTKDGGDSSNNNNIVFLASGKENKEAMKKIQEQLKVFFSNSGNQPSTGGKNLSQSRDTPSSWWQKNGEHIWKGMICALTYKENEEKTNDTQKIKKDEQVYEKIFGKPPNNDNPGTASTPTGTYNDRYQYDKVVLKEDDSDQKTDEDTIQPPTLKDFVLRPTYFRYLEEWGQNFCKKRKHKLAQIKHECKVEENGGGSRRGGITRQYSGDGEACNEMLPKNDGTVPDLEKPSCAKPCSSYRKWIERKGKEFEKQEKAYEQQKDKCVNGSNKHDNGFCETLTTSTEAKDFLKTLGPCKPNNVEGKTIFDDDKTFKHTKDCDPCLKFSVNCKKDECDNSKGTDCRNKNSIDATDIENGVDSTVLEMRVSADSKSGFNGDGLENACRGAGIFEGIRKDEWKCRNVCGYVVCKPENVNGEAKGKHIIQIRALVKRWVEYFFEDYNKIKHKISHRIKNGEISPCIKNCVEKWVDQKRKEWKEITERFKDQYKNDNSDDDNVRSFLETLIPQITDANAKNKVIKLSKFGNSCGCSASANEQNKNGEYKDAIDCMLKKLKDKIGECEKKHHQTSDTECSDTPQPQTLEDETLDDDIETEEAKKNMMPKICENVLKTAQQEDEGGCVPAENSEEPAATDSGKETPEQTPVLKPEEEAVPEPPPPPPQEKAPAPIPQPQPPTPPTQLLDNPHVLTALVTSTLAWSVGIGFATFTYFYLKKKTKSTIDLLRVINIPKSDYDIPTKLSPNRYIPYTSGKYRGKRYIYLEGDSGTDSGYTDHYSDITSSSESEYEELDINDIYVPDSPKYKTLIEVVLEPSGKLSGNTIPTSDKNTPSDTQNDIQNDDIPSSKITDNEWNTLKDEFISQYLQSEQPNDVPNDYTSGNSSTNTNITTMSRDNMEEKPFITSIQDRDLYTGEEIKYNINMSTNSMDDIPINRDNNVYSGIDLINDALNGDYDIYNEMLKRKENELFGTNHPKHTNTHNVAKPARDDPIHNQLNLFHKWLDRHRDMCEKWENHHERLAKLKEEWENETHSGNKHSDIPSGKLSDTPSDNNIHSDIHPSDIPSGKLSDIPSSNKTLNTDVSIQIHMDNPKSINQFTNMDSILEDLDKYKEPYYDVQDDIYYDVNDHDTSTVDTNAMDIPSKVQIEMDVNTKLVKEKYPIADVWDI